MNCHSLSVDFSNTTWVQRGLVNKQSGNAFGAITRIRPKLKYHDNYSITFGAIIRIKTIIIITFGTTNVLIYNSITCLVLVSVIPVQHSITFGTGIIISSRDHNVVTLVPCQI